MDIVLQRILSLMPKKENGDFVHNAKTEFAKSIGYKKGNIVSMWINGDSDSYLKKLHEIAAKYDVSVEWLQGLTDEKSPTPKSEANELLSIDSQLNDAGHTNFVRYGRFLLTQDEFKKVVDIPQPKQKIIPLFGASFAAGYGEPDFGNPFEDYAVPQDSKAEFAIRITGDSMEPHLHDGGVALAVKRNPQIGEVGAFLCDGEFIVKQFCEDGFGNVYLFSLNRERKDADKQLFAKDEHTLSCFGTVLMKRVPLPKE